MPEKTVPTRGRKLWQFSPWRNARPDHRFVPSGSAYNPTVLVFKPKQYARSNHSAVRSSLNPRTIGSACFPWDGRERNPEFSRKLTRV